MLLELLLGKSYRGIKKSIGTTFIYLNHGKFGYLSDKYPSIGYRCQASTRGVFYLIRECSEVSEHHNFLLVT